MKTEQGWRNHGKAQDWSEDHHEAFHNVIYGNSLLQPAYGDEIKEKLLQSGLCRRVMGGGLKATEEGMRIAYTGN